MLNEILCTEFKKGRIGFHPGLNVILGDDDAKNSIGKSSALMVIDFVHGGNSLLEDKSGALRELGPHIYNFSFKFAGKRYQFSRSTNAPDIVHLCNSNYESVEEITVYEFRRRLKEFHFMESLEGSFRYAIGPFSRIWGKGEMDPDHPFAANAKETTASAIARLVDLFNHSGAITSEKSVLEEQKSRKKLIVDSMNANIIPKIDKKKFSENVETISANA